MTDLININNSGSSDDKKIIVRFDKWLWAARFFKTRVLAKIAVESGLVILNNCEQNNNPSSEIKIGDTIVLYRMDYKNFANSKQIFLKIQITSLCTRRKNITEATKLYETIYDCRLESEKNKTYTPTKRVRFLRRSGKYDRVKI